MRPIRRRIAVGVSILALLGAGASAGAVARKKHGEVNALRRTVARMIAADIEGEIDRTERTLDTIGRSIGPGEIAAPGVPRVASRLAAAARRMPSLSRLVLLDASRRPVVAFDVDAPVGSELGPPGRGDEIPQGRPQRRQPLAAGR